MKALFMLLLKFLYVQYEYASMILKSTALDCRLMVVGRSLLCTTAKLYLRFHENSFSKSSL